MSRPLSDFKEDSKVHAKSRKKGGVVRDQRLPHEPEEEVHGKDTPASTSD